MELTEAQKFAKQQLMACIAGQMKTREAAIQMGLTQRCIQKKINRFKEKGDTSLINGHTGQKRINPVIAKRKELITDIFLHTIIDNKNPFEKISYMYFTEVLEEDYNIKASVSWVKKVLNELGYKTFKKYRKNKKENIHLFRPRKEYEGELVQADGTSFDWFGTGHLYCIQGFVDDATGIPAGLYMTKNECLLGYIEALREMCFKYGIPVSLYPDKASVFFVNQKLKNQETKKLTQFGKMMDKLGVDMFPAHSPEAKGRIERFWQVLQEQLPIQLKLRGITTIDEANKFLKDVYIPRYIKRHAKKAKNVETMFVKADMQEINSILKATTFGKTDKGGIFTLQGYKFFCPQLPNQKIKICLSEKDGLWVTPEKTEKRYEVTLVETDTSGLMPEVQKLLIEKTFLQNAKPLFREVYFDIDNEVMEAFNKKRVS